MSVPHSQPAELDADGTDLYVPHEAFVHPPRILPAPPAITVPTFDLPDSDAVPPKTPITVPTFDLPDSDGIPMETPWHLFAMTLLIEVVRSHLRQRNDFFVGGNMFVYYGTRQTQTWEFRGPDFFFVNNVDGTRERRYWLVYEEEGRCPDVVIELSSPSTAKEDHTTKKRIYERTFRTPDYYCYDPDSRLLEGWRLEGQRYRPLTANEHGRLWCEELSLWLGAWEGEHQGIRAVWLRFFDRHGELVPTFFEVERARALALEADLKAATAENARLKGLLENKRIEP